jgi:phosphoribosylamine--glycine ligase
LLLNLLLLLLLLLLQVMDEIVFATAKAMVSEGIPFRGVLFAGLMIKNGKVRN